MKTPHPSNYTSTNQWLRDAVADGASRSTTTNPMRWNDWGNSLSPTSSMAESEESQELLTFRDTFISRMPSSSSKPNNFSVQDTTSNVAWDPSHKRSTTAKRKVIMSNSEPNPSTKKKREIWKKLAGLLCTPWRKRETGTQSRRAIPRKLSFTVPDYSPYTDHSVSLSMALSSTNGGSDLPGLESPDSCGSYTPNTTPNHLTSGGTDTNLKTLSL